MYGTGIDSMLTRIKELNNVWASEGMQVELDEYCTVEEFATALQGYDYIHIAEHGCKLRDGVIIVTEDKVTIGSEQTYAKYKGLTMGRFESDPNNSYWCLTSDFFRENYSNNELSGSIVYLTTCNGYRDSRIVESIRSAGASAVIGYTGLVAARYDNDMQDAFVYSLMCGDTVWDALNYAKSIWGKDGNEYYKTYSNWFTRIFDDKEFGEARLYNGKNVKLVEINEKNPQSTTTATQPATTQPTTQATTKPTTKATTKATAKPTPSAKVIGTSNFGANGGNVKLTYHSDGSVLINGSGNIRDCGIRQNEAGGNPPGKEDFMEVLFKLTNSYQPNITKIVIQNGVTSIGTCAFWGLYGGKVKTITIPSSVNSIGDCAFQCCGELTDITIENGVKSIGNYTFSQCNNLKSIFVPSSVTTIGDEAFGNCEKLTIKGKAGSVAQKYAKSHNIKFVAI